jgi:hypothetical protein
MGKIHSRFEKVEPKGGEMATVLEAIGSAPSYVTELRAQSTETLLDMLWSTWVLFVDRRVPREMLEDNRAVLRERGVDPDTVFRHNTDPDWVEDRRMR